MQDVAQRPEGGFLKGIHRQRGVILAPLAYGLLAVAMTWPATARLGTHLAGGRPEPLYQATYLMGPAYSSCTYHKSLRVPQSLS